MGVFFELRGEIDTGWVFLMEVTYAALISMRAELGMEKNEPLISLKRKYD